MRRGGVAAAVLALVVLGGAWLLTRSDATGESAPAASETTAPLPAPPPHRSASAPTATTTTPWAPGQDTMQRDPFGTGGDASDDRTDHASPAEARRARTEELIETLSAKAEEADEAGNAPLAATYRERVRRLKGKLDDDAEPAP